MKVYLYDPESGIYEGEDFRDGSAGECEHGMTPVPPPDPACGQVAVFDLAAQQWTTVPTGVARQLLKLRGSTDRG